MLQHQGTFKERLAADELCLCMAVAHSRTADLPLIVEASGFDAFYVDMEHYAMSLETTSMLCTTATAAGMTSLVRVPSHDHHYISRVLDCGASGVIVPHVESAVEALAIVNSARFPPLGRRGVPGPNPVTKFQQYSVATTITEMDARVIIIAMLESAEAIDAADEIASVEGVDVLLVGSNDLALSLGIPGQLRSPLIYDAYVRVAEACSRHGKTLGIAGVRSDLELTKRLVALGARFLIAGSDTGYLLSAAMSSASELRGIEFERRSVPSRR